MKKNFDQRPRYWWLLIVGSCILVLLVTFRRPRKWDEPRTGSGTNVKGPNALMSFPSVLN